MSIHPDVVLEWKMSSLHKLNTYLVMQKKGICTCLESVAQVLDRDQVSELKQLKGFLRNLSEVIVKYCRVCIREEHIDYIDEKDDELVQAYKYLSTIQFCIDRIFDNTHMLVSRAKVYILLRIFCKGRIFMEKYLVSINFWNMYFVVVMFTNLGDITIQ